MSVAVLLSPSYVPLEAAWPPSSENAKNSASTSTTVSPCGEWGLGINGSLQYSHTVPATWTRGAATPSCPSWPSSSAAQRRARQSRRAAPRQIEMPCALVLFVCLSVVVSYSSRSREHSRMEHTRARTDHEESQEDGAREESAKINAEGHVAAYRRPLLFLRQEIRR